MKKAIVSAYKENAFIDSKSQLGIKGGMTGYVLAFDSAKFDDFTKALQQEPKLDQLIEACQRGLRGFVDERQIKGDSLRMELWIDRQTGRVAMINIDTKYSWKPYELIQGSQVEALDAKSRLELKFAYDSDVIEVPEKTLQYANLKRDIAEVKSFILAGDDTGQVKEAAN